MNLIWSEKYQPTLLWHWFYQQEFKDNVQKELEKMYINVHTEEYCPRNTDFW